MKVKEKIIKQLQILSRLKRCFYSFYELTSLVMHIQLIV